MSAKSDSVIQHLIVPDGVSIAVDLPEGKGLVSKQKYPKGSEIFDDLSFCHIVTSSRHEEFCAACLARSTPAKLVDIAS